MRQIIQVRRGFRLLEGSVTVPYVYYRASDGTYWRYDETEDLRAELRKVSRSYVEENFPTLDPDRHLAVEWPTESVEEETD